MLTADQIAVRAARRAAREAARALAQRNRELGVITVDALLPTRAARQAARTAQPTEMRRWVTPLGVELPLAADGVSLALARGTVATQDPAVAGVVAPALSFPPGRTDPCVVAATTSGPPNRTWLGLQWINADGTTNPLILWGKGPGRVIVQGFPPPTATGARALLVCYSVAAADLTGRDTPTRVIQQALRAWITANRPEDLP